MGSLETAYYRKALSAVLADNQRPIRLKQPVWVFGINNQVGKVERTPDHPLTFIAFLPRRAAVVRNKQCALWRFDKRVNALRFRGCDPYRQTSIRFFRESFISLLRNLRPCIATIGRTEQSTG